MEIRMFFVEKKIQPTSENLLKHLSCRYWLSSLVRVRSKAMWGCSFGWDMARYEPFDSSKHSSCYYNESVLQKKSSYLWELIKSNTVRKRISLGSCKEFIVNENTWGTCKARRFHLLFCLFVYRRIEFSNTDSFFLLFCNFFKFLAERVLLRFEIFQKKQKMIVISLDIYWCLKDNKSILFPLKKKEYLSMEVEKRCFFWKQFFSKKQQQFQICKTSITPKVWIICENILDCK